jgi:hypothetical protein
MDLESALRRMEGKLEAMEALRLEDHEASKSQHDLQQRISEQDGELRAV